MARQQSETSLDKLGFARNEEEKDFQVITITSPLGGLYDLGNIFPIPADGLTKAQNNTFRRLALEKRPGIKEVGQRLNTSIECKWGGQYKMTNGASPPAAQLTMLRANAVLSTGVLLYKLVDWFSSNPDNWYFVGVCSGDQQGTAADFIASGLNYGTVVVRSGILYYADGGSDRKCFIFTPATIKNWGLNWSTPAAGTIASEATSGDGYLLTGRNYSFKYQVIDEQTGFKSQLSAVSNVFKTTLAGDDVTLTGSVPAQGGLPNGTYTVRIWRSTGAVPPSVPASWLFEKDYEGITNLGTTSQTITLNALDGDIGPTEATEVYPQAPRGQFVMYDPSGDRALLFGDPTAPNVVYWSEDGNFGNWPPIQQTAPIEDDDGDPLNGGWVGLNGRVFVMKRRRGVYELVQSVNGAYTPQKLTNAFGCWSHFSIACRGTSLYWLTLEGAVEFNGSEIKNISDDKIRRLFEVFAKAESEAIDYVPPYAIDQRQPGSPTIEWVVRDPTTQGIYRMIYNIPLQNWTMMNSDSGIGYNVQFHARDHVAGVGDGLEHIYLGDSDGRIRRLGSDMDANEIFYDEYQGIQREYTWDVRTAWYGNGLDTHIPRYCDFLMQTVPASEANGDVTVSLYVNGNDTEQHSLAFPIPTTTEFPDQLYVRYRFRCDSKKLPCNMFRFGFKHTVANGHPIIPWMQFKYTVDAPRLRGHINAG